MSEKQDEINRQFIQSIATLEQKAQHHDEILRELKDSALKMVDSMNGIKIALIVLSIGVFLNAGPLQPLLTKLLTH